MSTSESLSALDAAWLRMESPSNRMVICGMLLFDERVDFDALRDTVSSRMLRFHRLRQRVREDAFGWHWEEDEGFDLDWHLHHVQLPQAPHALEEAAGELLGMPLDATHPMWQLHLFDGPGAGSALLLRIHHCYGDGFALLHMVAAMTDEDPARPNADVADVADPQPARAAWDRILGAPAEAMADALRAGMDAFEAGRDLLLAPWRALGYAQEGGAYLREAATIAAMQPDSATRLKGPLGAVKRLAWSAPLPLAQVKALAEALACTVNDVLLGCVAGALRDWLIAQGDAIDDAEVRALVPVNLRPPGPITELGNRFGLVFLELPLGMADPVARVQCLHERMAALRHAHQPEVSLAILSAMGMAPEFARERLLQTLSANASMVASSVHGPDTPRWLAGARIARELFWVPQSGGIGMGLSLFSYAGSVSFGIVADAHRVSEPAEIAANFTLEFETLLLSALLMPWPIARLAAPSSADAV